MKRIATITSFLIAISSPLAIAQDFGPADFPGDTEKNAPKSYHDAWCRQLEKECRVIFSGRRMTVEGFRGIEREQLIGFRTERDIKGKERYFYVKYLNNRGFESTALFMFVKKKASREFGLALSRWYEQDPKPYPNYRYPASQGPQDTHGRDKELNPYGETPLKDLKGKTTE